MDKENIREYIKNAGEVEAPTLQREFSLTYAETKAVLDGLVKEGTLEYASGVMYRLKNRFAPKDGEKIYKPKDAKEAGYINALRACVRMGGVSLEGIQHHAHMSYAQATEAIAWMEYNKFIETTPTFRLLITREEFIAKFGAIGDESGLPARQTKSSLDAARELWRYLNESGTKTERKEDEDDGEEFDQDDMLLIADDDEDLEDYIEEDGAGRHYVEVDDDGDEDEDEEGPFAGYDFEEDTVEDVGAKVILQSL